MTFFLVGIPGIFVALLIFMTLREPPRGLSEKVVKTPAPVATDPAPSIGEVFAFLWKKRSFKHISLAAALHAFVSYGAGTWNAPFLNRIHEIPLTEVGGWLGLISGIGAIGTFAGGYLSDKISDRTGDRRWYLWVSGIAPLVMVPFQFTAYLYGGMWAVIPALMLVAILGGMFLGPTFAMTQGLVTLRMRAVASAILLFVLNIIGMGLGPFFVGIASDALIPSFGGESLRYALCLSVVVNVWAATHYFVGAKYLREDLDATEAIYSQAASGATKA
jgi:MFS family permease